jgi:hypothetical protein
MAIALGNCLTFRTFFIRIMALALVIGGLACGGRAQVTASIRGTVTDASGASVAGAKVAVKSATLGIERTTETNTAGEFEVPALPPGSYEVQVQKPGFGTQMAKDVVLQVSQNTLQNFTLRVADSSIIVTVESTLPVVDSTTMTVGQVIDKNVVQEIPLNGRHFVDLAQLIPGTATAPANGFLTSPIRGQGALAFNSAGGREDAINFMVNGVNLSDMVQNQITFQPTINTVSEFKIDNSTYSAEFGRNSGSIVNIATRSGTEAFHGEAYDYLRNNWFDARNFFNPQFTSTGAPNPQSALKRNQFGGDFGGPIRKGKTYFFASYEGLRHVQGLNTAANVLSDAQRTTIQGSSNTVAKALLALIPASNGTLNGAPGFFGSATAPVNIDQTTVDINHNFSTSDQLHGFYAYQHDLRHESTAGATIPGFGDTREGHRQVLTIGETHVFSPSLVNEGRLGLNRIHITFDPNNLTNPNSVGLGSVLGPNETFLPSIRITSLGLTFGSETGFPQGRGDTTVFAGDTLTYLRGRHSFKFGGEFRDFRNNNFNGDPGRLTFNTDTNFINGIVDSCARTVGNVADRITENALDLFAQDSFKLKPAFTLELGLRYSWNMTPSEAKNRFVVFDPATSSLLQEGSGFSDVYTQNNKNFQPRVGFAWDLFHTGKTILRGGYGYLVDQPITGFVNGLPANPPFALPISTSAAQTFAGLTGIYSSPTPSNLSPQAINHNFKDANVQSWNLNVQHQITRDTAIMIGYFGSKGTHLEIDRNINQPEVLGNAATRPFKTLSGTILNGTTLAPNIREFDSSSNSSYSALWVTANKRVSRGLQFNASYTYSHSIDDNSRNSEGIVMQDSNNIGGERASSDFDARHRFVINSVYELPFKGNRVVAGWELATIITAQSGNPFNVVLGTATLTGVPNSVRPTITGPLVITGNPAGWFANAAAVFPASANSPATGFGNLGRNAFTGPGFTDVDLSGVRNTKLTERMDLQFRVDAFDLFNHPNFGQPGPFSGLTSSVLTFSKGVPASSFGAVTNTRFPTADAGSSRQLQLALKLRF